MFDKLWQWEMYKLQILIEYWDVVALILGISVLVSLILKYNIGGNRNGK